MNEFQFDLESLSELGLAPELLLPDDDLLLGLQDWDAKPTYTRAASFQATNKQQVLQELESTFIDPSSDLFSFLEMTEIPEVTETYVVPETNILAEVIEACEIGSPASFVEVSSPLPMDMENTQSLIDEVENFLKSVEGTVTVVEDSTPITVEGNHVFIEDIGTPISTVIIDEVFPAETQLQHRFEHVTTQEVSVPITTLPSTDTLLQALATGNVALDDSGISLSEEDLSRAFTTTMLTEDGEKVVIIIAPPSPAPASPANSFVSDVSFVVPQATSPAPSISPGPSVTSFGDDDSSYDTDPDYSPSCTPKTRKLTSSTYQIREISYVPEEKPRRKYQRHNRPQPPQGPYPQDKKERKKAQNRTAAFRYREKKKQEQDLVDNEVDNLVQRNVTLKANLADVEGELRILKKLMTEAGLGKYAQAANRHSI